MKRDAPPSKKLDNFDRQKTDLEERCKELLLLGAGQTGKTTLFKQCIWFHRKFDPKEAKNWGQRIITNTLFAFRVLIEHAQLLDISVSLLCIEARKRVFAFETDAELLTKDICADMIFLWNEDEAIKYALENKDNFQYEDSLDYFTTRLHDLSSFSYIPTFADCLNLYARTLGVAQCTVKIRNVQLKIWDVEGQRNQRRKWVHVYKNPDWIVFVVNLNGYNRVLYEDRSHDRLKEDLELFDEVINLKVLEKSDFCIFFNQRDLFRKKIEGSSDEIDICLPPPLIQIVRGYLGGSPLSRLFPEYQGGPDYDKALAFIQEKFLAVDRRPLKEEKPLLTFVSCMLNTQEVEGFMNQVVDCFSCRQAPDK